MVGRLKQDRWKDKDGRVHSKVKVVGESVEFKTQFDKKPQEVREEEEVPAF